MTSSAIIIWISLIYMGFYPTNQGENVTSSSSSNSSVVTRNSIMPIDTSLLHNSSTPRREANETIHREAETIQQEDSILSLKFITFAKLSSLSSTENRKNNSLMDFIRTSLLPKQTIQPRINPLAPLLILLRILLLPLRILLAPVIVLLRALIELVRLLLRLLNPIFLIFLFLGAVNMAANIARIIMLILRIIFESLRRRRKDKDEERDVRVITIVKDHTTPAPVRIYHSKPKHPHPKANHHHHHPTLPNNKRKAKHKVSRTDFQQQTIEDIMEKERLIISKLTCLGALTFYPADRVVSSSQRWVMLDPYIQANCGFNAIPNPNYLPHG